MTAPDGLTLRSQVHFGTEARGRKRLREGTAPVLVPVERGSVPRVARLLALAHRFEGMVREGVVQDYGALARAARVSRPRVTQIMNLLLLAPDIQEAVLDLPRTVEGRDAVTERDLRVVAAEPVWERQRAMWGGLVGERP